MREVRWRLQKVRDSLRASFWFIPAIAIALVVGLWAVTVGFAGAAAFSILRSSVRRVPGFATQTMRATSPSASPRSW